MHGERPMHCMGEGAVNRQSLLSRGWDDPREMEMATHSSILAWENPMNRGAWWAITVHRVPKSLTRFNIWAHLQLLSQSSLCSSLPLPSGELASFRGYRAFLCTALNDKHITVNGHLWKLIKWDSLLSLIRWIQEWQRPINKKSSKGLISKFSAHLELGTCELELLFGKAF